MIDQILKTVLEGSRGEVDKYKKDLGTKAMGVAKKYWKMLVAAFVVIVLIIMAVIWALWSIISSATQSVGVNGGDIVQKVETVGINGLIEEPLQFVRDIWYGKDGK